MNGRDTIQEAAREASAHVTVADMMRARDAREQLQRALLARHAGASLVCLTMNIAGPVKTTKPIERAFSWALERVRAVLAPHTLHQMHLTRDKTGPQAVFCVDAPARTLKTRLCALEDDSPLGRLLDIDVISPDGDKLERTQLGLPARRCLLCDAPAPVCARSRAHSVDALFARTHAIIRAHFEQAFLQKTACSAERALLYEAAATPKPGLVDRANSGAHTDMDFFTFLDSACALRAYFSACARTGLAHRGASPADCFDALRTPGLMAEADMLAATGGVNTHKGAIFSLGILCASLGMGYDGERSDVHAALLRCGEMTRARMREELSAAPNASGTSFGMRLYALTGIGGVRAEAAGGFQSVRETALPRLNACMAAGMHANDAGLCALLALMACTQDTNALRRGGEEGANALRARAAQLDSKLQTLLADEGFQQAACFVREQLGAWDAYLTCARISPGGCADLLALTFLCHFMDAPEA